MTEAETIDARGASLALAITGLLVLLGSSWTWGSCPTTPCGGMLQAFSQYSGLDLGFGVVTAPAGVMLIAIGLGALSQNGVSRFATTAELIALLIVATAGASIVWMYVVPGDDKDFRWPPYVPIFVAIVGLIAVAASLRLRRAMPGREKQRPQPRGGNLGR